jgi:hypothetical protein
MFFVEQSRQNRQIKKAASGFKEKKGSTKKHSFHLLTCQELELVGQARPQRKDWKQIRVALTHKKVADIEHFTEAPHGQIFFEGTVPPPAPQLPRSAVPKPAAV